ncbi:MAG: hypothetical protein KC422_04625 [Trueperaceae bacterium]|nr:hypothetical protein [Trueperaceae bacterium]
MPYVLALDAGNSKTLALIARLNGEIIAFGRSKCGDISNREIGSAQALGNVLDAIAEALAMAKLQPDDIIASAFSMAGADWPEDFSYLKHAFSKYPWANNSLVINDAMGALRASLKTGFGVAVVCGTYAVTAARAPSGKSWHASFWQETGGAFKLGQEGLKAIYRAALGIDPETSLIKAIGRHLQKNSVEEILHLMTARDSVVLESDIARLAPIVLSEAAKGDASALTIVQTQARVLADYVGVAARKVGLEHFELSLNGGVFRHPSDLLVTALSHFVKQTYPDVQISKSDNEPVIGALLYGLEHAQINLTPGIYQNIKATLPHPSFFHT